MTSIFEKIKKRRKTDDGYILQSHWTSSDTVEVDDNGTTLSTKLDEIDQNISGLSEDKANKSTTLSGYGITDAINISAKGSANGVAPLDENGLITSSYLPSYVDDILEGTADGVIVDDTTGSQTATGFILINETEPCTPESGKIYVDVLTNISYRWSGTIFVTVGSPLTLGETAYTAYAGDKGKYNADAIRLLQLNKQNKINQIYFTNENTYIFYSKEIMEPDYILPSGSSLPVTMVTNMSPKTKVIYAKAEVAENDLVILNNNIVDLNGDIYYQGLYYVTSVKNRGCNGTYPDNLYPVTIIKIKSVEHISTSGRTGNYEDLLNKPSINGHTLIGNLTNDDLGLSSGGDGATEVFIGDVEPTDENITIWVNPSDEPDIIPGGGNAGIHVGEDIPTQDDVVIWLNPNGASYTITEDYKNNETGIFSQTGAYNLYNEIQSNIPTVTDNLTTDTSGTALDAKQGKILDGKISQLNDDLTETMSNVSAHDTAIADLTVEQSTQASNISNLDIEVGKKANKTEIPTVNNGTLTIQKNGSNVTTFTANQSGNATANISVPDGAISDAYNASTTYTAGQYCLYNNSLWKCKTQCKGQTPAENSYWTKRSLGQEIKQMNSDLSDKSPKSDVAYNYVDVSNASIVNVGNATGGYIRIGNTVFVDIVGVTTYSVIAFYNIPTFSKNRRNFNIHAFGRSTYTTLQTDMSMSVASGDTIHITGFFELY